jgi:cytochrome c oxidase subunit 2
MRPRGPLAAALLVAVAAACGGDGGSGGSDGQRITRRSGCAACHGSDGQGGIGPAWDDSLGTEIALTDGTTVVVDEEYLTRAIADPRAQVRAGFDVTMPTNQLTEEEIAAVVAYIVELNDEGSG